MASISALSVSSSKPGSTIIPSGAVSSEVISARVDFVEPVEPAITTGLVGVCSSHREA